MVFPGYRFRFFLSLCCFASLLGCRPFHRDFAAGPHACGLEEAAWHPDHSYVKLLNQDGRELSPATLQGVQARLLSTAGIARPVAVSARGCVEVSEEAGLLQAFAVSPALHVSWKFTRDDVRPGSWQSVKLERPATFSADLLCLNEGLFTHDRLPFPLRLESDGSMAGVRLQIAAHHESGDRDVVLYAKDYGDTGGAWPEALDTSRLKEGSYSLRLKVQKSLAEWDQAAPGDGSFCELHVLHGTPGIHDKTGLIPGVRSVLALNDPLPWQPTNSYTTLQYCREERGDDEDQAASIDSSCQPKQGCQDPAQYQFTLGKTLDKPGVFDYYLKAQDRSGLTAPLACQRVIVTKPQQFLQLDWTEPGWNRPAAVMNPARAALSADVFIRHSELLDQDISKRLECKVDVLVDGKTVLAGKDFICSSGRCKNQSMETYRPCDAHIDVSLNRYFQRESARASLLRLWVRADDGSGRNNELVRSVWLHPQRWTVTETRLEPNNPLSSAANSLAQDDQGHIFAAFYPYVGMRTRTDDKWRLAPMPFTITYGSTQLFKDKTGVIYAEGISVADADNHRTMELSRWNGEIFEKLPDYPGLDACMYSITPHPKEGLWCITKTQVLRYTKAAGWQALDWPLDSGLQQPCGSWIYSTNLLQQEDAAGRLWVYCSSNRELWSKEPAGSWQMISRIAAGATSISLDPQGRLWRVLAEYPELSVARWEGDHWRILPVPPLRSAAPPQLNIFADGRLVLMDYVWDETAEQWRRLPGVDRLWPLTSTLAYENDFGQTVLVTPIGLALARGNDYRIYPFTWYDRQVQGYDPDNVLFVSEDDVYAVAQQDRADSKLYRMQGSDWNTFGYEVNLFNKGNNGHLFNRWIEADGSLTLGLTSRGLVHAGPAGWEDKFPADADPIDIAERFTADSYVVSNYHKFWRWKQGALTPLDLPQADSSGIFNMAPNPRGGEIWVYQYQASRVWRVTEDSVAEFSSPIPLNYLWSFEGRMLASADQGFMTFDPAKQSWVPLPLTELGLPDTAGNLTVVRDARARVEAPEELLYQVGDEYFLRTRTGAIENLALPPMGFNSIGSFLRLGDHDYLLAQTGMGGVYRGDGRNWTPIISERMIMNRFPDMGSFYCNWLIVDPFDRLWMSGQPIGLLMLDLK